MIKIRRSVFEAIIAHAKKDVPIEACGYLAGKNGVITRQYLMKNTDNSPEHFSFDPEEQFKVMRSVRNEGLDLIANYHSHPETPARPSREDIRLAFDPNILYFIISLAQANIDVKAFRINSSTVEKAEIEVIE